MATLLEQITNLYAYSEKISQYKSTENGHYENTVMLLREYEKICTQIFQKYNGHKNSLSLIKGLLYINTIRPEFVVIVFSLIDRILANHSTAL